MKPGSRKLSPLVSKETAVVEAAGLVAECGALAEAHGGGNVNCELLLGVRGVGGDEVGEVRNRYCWARDNPVDPA